MSAEKLAHFITCWIFYISLLCENSINKKNIYIYICLCIEPVWLTLSTEEGSTEYRCQFCPRSAGQRKLFFPCRCSRQGICSRKTGSAVSSRVSPLILYAQAEYDAYSRDSSRFPRRRPSIPSTPIGSVPRLSGHVFPVF